MRGRRLLPEPGRPASARTALVRRVPARRLPRPRRLIHLLVLALLATLGSIVVAPAAAQASSTFKILQLNLCNSGYASCYTAGNSIREAQSLIDALRPDAVFLNEICRSDLTALADNGYYRYPTRHFAPVWNSSTQSNYQCKDGRGDYGNGILVSASQLGAEERNRYTYQSATSEHRVYGCARFYGFVGCTTHLTTTKSIAMNQCNELTRTRMPAFVTAIGEPTVPTIMSGDLNLVYNTWDTYNVQKCVPSGHTRKGDGGVQHITVTNSITFNSVKVYGLTYTDHDGLLATTTVPWNAPTAAHHSRAKAARTKLDQQRWTVRTLIDS